MLFVVFSAGGDRYAIEAGRVHEVIPRVTIRPAPGTPSHVAGLMVCRGQVIPALDMSQWLTQMPALGRFSTRILVVSLKGGALDGRAVGLIAESVTQAVSLDAALFASGGIASAAFPFLGNVASDDQGLIRRVDVDRLVSPELVPVLFPDAAPAAASVISGPASM